MRPTDGVLRAIKIRSMTFFGREVKLLPPCHNSLQHVKDSLRYDRNSDRQNSMVISCPVSPFFATRCLLQQEQRNVVDELRIIRSQIQSTIDQKMVAVARDALYNTTP
jgi:hypothetical protein